MIVDALVRVQARRTARVQVFTFNLESATLDPVHEMRLPDPAGIQFIRPPVIRAQGKAYAFSYLGVLSNLHLVDGLR